MAWLTRTLGVVLIAIAIIDIFMTVLYPRTGKSLLSMPVSKGTWKIFRQVARWSKSVTRSDAEGSRVLSYCGSVVLVFIAIVWIASFIIGFGLIVWTMLGDQIVASQGKTPTGFGTALYYSGYNFTTLGIGNLIPKSTICQLLTVLQAALGFATFTVTLTYLLSVLNALTQRNVFALSLHHRMAGKANVARLLLGWGMDDEFTNTRSDITSISRDLFMLLESHHSYPILHYFRFSEPLYSLARMIYITMDTAALLQSALHQQHYRALINSTAVAELQTGGLYMLEQLSDSFLPNRHEQERFIEKEWREWYFYVVKQLKSSGIKTPEDIEAGADLYVSLRREWNGEVAAFAKHMAFRWHEIVPTDLEKISTFPLIQD